MSRTPVIVALCVCTLGVFIGLLLPLGPAAERGGGQPAERPLLLPSGELPRKEAVIALLGEQQYDELEKIYSLTLAADRQSATDDLDRFSAFAYADPALQEALDGWVDGHRASPLPLIARGEYYRHLAYTVRGDKFRSETTPEQFEEMRRFLALADQDFQRALEIGPPSVAAYEGLIDIAITDSERREAKTLLDRALAATDNSLPLHLTYMRALEPRWGGERGMTADYWKELRRSGTLRHSERYLDYVDVLIRAEEACGANECTSAIAFYEEAMSILPERQGLLGHARALGALQRYGEALSVIDGGLQRNLDSPEHHEFRAIVLSAANRYEEAAASIGEALKLDPYNPNFLMVGKEISERLEKARQQAGDVSAANRYRQQADDAVERAMVYGALRADVQLAWARTILGRGGPREDAYAAFKEAMRLAPNDPEYVLNYGHALAAAKDCSALEIYRRFEKMCRSGGYCDQYVSLDVLTRGLLMQCDKSDAARKKRMVPGTLARMESCKADYNDSPADVALARCREKAEAGDRAAAFDLGIINIYGYGVDIDESNGLRWLELAAGRGHLKAKASLGTFVHQGIGTERDVERGLRLLSEAAEAGEVTAMFSLGLIYQGGSEDDPNLEESRYWLTQASDLGSVEAQRALQRFFSDESVRQ